MISYFSSSWKKFQQLLKQISVLDFHPGALHTLGKSSLLFLLLLRTLFFGWELLQKDLDPFAKRNVMERMRQILIFAIGKET